MISVCQTRAAAQVKFYRPATLVNSPPCLLMHSKSLLSAPPSKDASSDPAIGPSVYVE